jgi:hypothetical protein
MGFNPGLLDQVTQWGLKRGSAMLDIGASDLFCADDPSSLNRFVGHFGGRPYPTKDLEVAARARAADLFARAGMRYRAIDITAYGPETIAMDLNVQSLPFWRRRRYDLVTNCGTTEHILNQLNAFKLIHDACKVGGLMYHGLPLAGDYTHGLVAYRPRFFRLLAGNNGYEVVAFWGWADNEILPYEEDLAGWVPPLPITFNVPHIVNSAWLHILLRKTSAARFRPPLDCIRSFT